MSHSNECPFLKPFSNCTDSACSTHSWWFPYSTILRYYRFYKQGRNNSTAVQKVCTNKFTEFYQGEFCLSHREKKREEGQVHAKNPETCSCIRLFWVCRLGWIFVRLDICNPRCPLGSFALPSLRPQHGAMPSLVLCLTEIPVQCPMLQRLARCTYFSDTPPPPHRNKHARGLRYYRCSYCSI